MTDQVKEPVAEVQEESKPVEEKRQVPLEALEAERSKRQEAEGRARMYEEYLLKSQQQQVKEEEDPDELVTHAKFKSTLEQSRVAMKREVLEQTFTEMNPQAVKEINESLPKIIEQKPWVKEVIENSPNRWARAYEMVKDFAPKPEVSRVSQKLEENAKKPGSPVSVGKSAQMSKVDYLRSISGKKEFREYRQKVLSGEA